MRHIINFRIVQVHLKANTVILHEIWRAICLFPPCKCTAENVHARVGKESLDFLSHLNPYLIRDEPLWMHFLALADITTPGVQSDVMPHFLKCVAGTFWRPEISRHLCTKLGVKVGLHFAILFQPRICPLFPAKIWSNLCCTSVSPPSSPTHVPKCSRCNGGRSWS